MAEWTYRDYRIKVIARDVIDKFYDSITLHGIVMLKNSINIFFYIMNVQYKFYFKYSWYNLLKYLSNNNNINSRPKKSIDLFNFNSLNRYP